MGKTPQAAGQAAPRRGAWAGCQRLKYLAAGGVADPANVTGRGLWTVASAAGGDAPDHRRVKADEQRGAMLADYNGRRARLAEAERRLKQAVDRLRAKDQHQAAFAAQLKGNRELAQTHANLGKGAMGGRAIGQPAPPFPQERFPAAVGLALLAVVLLIGGCLLRADPSAVALHAPQVPPGGLARGVEVHGRREMCHGLGRQAILLAPHAEVGVRLRQLAISLELGGESGLMLVLRPQAVDGLLESSLGLRQPGPPPVVVGEHRPALPSALTRAPT